MIVRPDNYNAQITEKESRQSLKRRKSSPLLDPIPSYNPTPIHILEQRSKTISTKPSTNSNPTTTFIDYDNITYTPTPISSNNIDDVSPSYSSSSSSNNNDYTPLLGPSSAVVGHTTTQKVSVRRKAPRSNSASAVRPVVSSELAQAVVRRRNSQIANDKNNLPASIPTKITTPSKQA